MWSGLKRRSVLDPFLTAMPICESFSGTRLSRWNKESPNEANSRLSRRAHVQFIRHRDLPPGALDGTSANCARYVFLETLGRSQSNPCGSMDNTESVCPDLFNSRTNRNPEAF